MYANFHLYSASDNCCECANYHLGKFIIRLSDNHSRMVISHGKIIRIILQTGEILELSDLIMSNRRLSI